MFVILFDILSLGGDLFSHINAVSSALKCLTSVFGMVTGCSIVLELPRELYIFWSRGTDSNRRPLGYEPNELPLLHPATKYKRIITS